MNNMSVFDKLQNYSSRKVKQQRTAISDVLDVSTPQGAFLAQVHNSGYKIYNSLEWYRGDNDKLVVPQDIYDSFDEETKKSYKPRVKEYSELYYALTTKGNQEINAIAGSGKALVNGTLVLTDNGYRPIETLKVSDKVYGQDGAKSTVLGVYPQGKQDVYSVTFSDNKTIYCNKEHLWTLTDGKVVTTEELRENDALPTIMPLEFDKMESELVVSPYTLACIYALGSLENEKIVIRTNDNLVVETLKEDNSANDIVDLESDKHILLLNKNLISFCKNLNLFSQNADFVLPKEYLYSEITERLAFLLGLLDTMGKNEKGKFVLEIKSDIFANDLIFLIESLGLLCETEKKEDKNIIYISFTDNYVGYFISDQLDQVLITERFVKGVKKENYQQEMTCIQIDNESHLYLTEHCIPTHNTTALIFKVMHDIVTGEAMKKEVGMDVPKVNNMWVCTFLKSGAIELGEKLAYWQKKFGYIDTHHQVVFSTLDAEFKRCLNAMGVATPLDSEMASKLLKETIDDLGIRRDGEPLRQEDYSTIESIVTYYRGRLTNRYSHPSAIDYDLNGSIMDLLVKQFADKRKVAGIMDFDEMSEILYQYLYVTPNPKVQDFVANRYNYIYIDEFQDTSQLAYAILKFYARGKLAVNNGKKEVQTVTDINLVTTSDDDSIEFDGLVNYISTLGKVVVIGDTSQCIYSFRGSDSTILAVDFAKDFAPTKCALSYNWRCPSNILKPIVPCIHQNTYSKHQLIQASNEGGEFFAYDFATYKAMVDKMQLDVEKDLNDGLNVAILVRTNYDGAVPAFVLATNAKYDFSLSGNSMTLNTALPRKLLKMTSLLTEKTTPAVLSCLLDICSYTDRFAIRNMVATLKGSNKGIWEVPMTDIHYSCPSLEPFVTYMESLYFTDGKKDRSKEMLALRGLYIWLHDRVYNGQSTYAESARAYIETILYILDSAEFDGVYDFIEEMDFIGEKLNGKVGKEKAPITIATVHESKGKEYDSVYVWNVIDGQFPSNKTNLNNINDLEEERRIFYIACTRAKKREHIYTVQGRHSMFLDEMDIELKNPISPSVTLKN